MMKKHLCTRNVIVFTQVIKRCDLAFTCMGELQKIPSTIGTLEKSIVDRKPQHIFEVLFLWYKFYFLNKSGEKIYFTL